MMSGLIAQCMGRASYLVISDGQPLYQQSARKERSRPARMCPDNLLLPHD